MLGNSQSLSYKNSSQLRGRGGGGGTCSMGGYTYTPDPLLIVDIFSYSPLIYHGVVASEINFTSIYILRLIALKVTRSVT